MTHGATSGHCGRGQARSAPGEGKPSKTVMQIYCITV